MKTSSSNALFASTRSARSFGLLIAGGILFAVTVGGSSALYGAYTSAIAQMPLAAVHAAV
jgi:hypothetical protein